ncbi:hypothetical protein EDC01DRAFT_782244 [Geopyxis carbonaria]|nr:hypothetical protein EDC01DRAFT_782244 [Geopyxis carbonaria]
MEMRFRAAPLRTTTTTRSLLKAFRDVAAANTVARTTKTAAITDNAWHKARKTNAETKNSSRLLSLAPKLPALTFEQQLCHNNILKEARRRAERLLRKEKERELQGSNLGGMAS